MPNNSLLSKQPKVSCSMDRASYSIYQAINRSAMDRDVSFSDRVLSGHDVVTFHDLDGRICTLGEDVITSQELMIIPVCICKSHTTENYKMKSIKLSKNVAEEVQAKANLLMTVRLDNVGGSLTDREYQLEYNTALNQIILGSAMNSADRHDFIMSNLDDMRCNGSLYGLFYTIIIIDSDHVRVIGHDWVIPANDARIICSPQLLLELGLDDLESCIALIERCGSIQSIDMDHSYPIHDASRTSGNFIQDVTDDDEDLEIGG